MDAFSLRLFSGPALLPLSSRRTYPSYICRWLLFLEEGGVKGGSFGVLGLQRRTRFCPFASQRLHLIMPKGIHPNLVNSRLRCRLRCCCPAPSLAR